MPDCTHRHGDRDAHATCRHRLLPDLSDDPITQCRAAGGRNRAVCLGNIGDAGVIEPTPAGLVAAEQQGHLDLVRIPGPSVVSEDAPAQF